MGSRTQGQTQHGATNLGLSWKQLGADALGLNLTLGALLLGSVKYDAEIWVHDYPPDIRERFGPRSERSTKRARLLAIPFFGILLGGVVQSNLRLRKRNQGRLSFRSAFLNVYLLLLAFWAFDLTVLDWLIFVRIKPDFIVLPGTEGMAGYDDYGFHLRAALPALIWMAIPALFIAWVTANDR
jgi:hypothetical protein